MLENFQGDSWGSIPPLRMPSLLPHDLCHGRSSSRWLPVVIEFQLSYSRSWKMMLWKVLHSICNMQYALNMQYAGSRHSNATVQKHQFFGAQLSSQICYLTLTLISHFRHMATYLIGSIVSFRPPNYKSIFCIQYLYILCTDLHPNL